MKRIPFILWLACVLTGCLNYAYNYDYQHSDPPVPYAGTAYEYIRSRSEDKFSLWYEAIEAGGMQDLYEQEGNTYFMLEDDQLVAWLTSWHYSSVSEMPQSAINTLLLGYTIPGEYSTLDMTTTPIDVTSYDEEHIIRMRLYPTVSTASQNLHGMQAGWVNMDGTVDYRGISSSNIQTKNGIIHVVSSRFVRKQNQ